jgi:hypothetical protein
MKQKYEEHQKTGAFVESLSALPRRSSQDIQVLEDRKQQLPV